MFAHKRLFLASFLRQAQGQDQPIKTLNSNTVFSDTVNVFSRFEGNDVQYTMQEALEKVSVLKAAIDHED